MNTVMSYVVWIFIIAVIMVWLYKNFFNSPQNHEEFLEYYSNVEWDIDYDYEEFLEGLEDYINSQTHESGQVVSTRNYFKDANGTYIDKKYVNKATIDLMNRMYSKNGYECLMFCGPSNEKGEISNSFYRNKTPLYEVRFTKRYYEDMNKKPSYNQNIVNSNIGFLAQGGEDNAFNNISAFVKGNISLIEYINDQMKSIENKRERRVLEDIVEILEEDSYPSKKEVDEVTSEVKKRPFALKILQNAGIKFSEEASRIKSSEAVKWFITWINNL